MGFFRQEYWRGLPFPPPEDLPDPGIEPVSSALRVDSLPLSLRGSLYLKAAYSHWRQLNEELFKVLFATLKTHKVRG